MAGTLGTWWIEVSARGTETTKAALTSVTKTAEKAAFSLGNMFANAARLAAGTLLALNAAGLAGTQEGNKLAYSFQMLGREIAAVTLPAIRATIEGMQKLTGWFRELSGAQQENILKWGGLATGLTLFTTGLGTIPGAILTVVSAFKLLQGWWEKMSDFFAPFVDGMKEKLSSLVESYKAQFEAIGNLVRKLEPVFIAVFKVVVTAIGWAVSAIQVVVDAITYAIKKLEQLLSMLPGYQKLSDYRGMAARTAATADRMNRDAEGKGNKERNSLSPVPGRFEAITSSYARLQTEVSRTDTTPKKQLDAQVAANEKLDKIAAATDATARKVGAILPA